MFNNKGKIRTFLYYGKGTELLTDERNNWYRMTFLQAAYSV